MPSHISLPNERVEQLRMIAKARNTSIPEVIAGYVRAEIEAGTIPAEIPGIKIVNTGPVITIKAGDFSAEIPAAEGPVLADLLRDAGSLKADPERKKRWLEGLAGLSGIKVKRAGNGLKVVSPLTGREFALNLDVAVDLGDQIEKKAK